MVVLLYFPGPNQPSIDKNIDKEVDQYRNDNNH